MNNTTKVSTAICVFAHKRPDHLSACLSALLENEEARDLDLRVYVDGPKRVADADAHHKVLNVCDQAWPFSSFKVFQRKVNVGLYKSLTSGISEALLEYESVIVIEDDIQSSPFLIKYLLDGLYLYQDTKKVASIHGYTPPIKEQLPQTFFLRGADCWGWATWRDRWGLFRHDASAMAAEIRQRGLVNEFNLNGAYDYLAMLDARANGLNNSWAICWHASCFLANKLTLYPGKSLVKNIGLDGSGEHCGPSKVMETEASQSPVRIYKTSVEVDTSTYLKYCRHYSSSISRNQVPTGIIKKIKAKLFQVANRRKYSGFSLSGPYDSYELAAQSSSGYNSEVILDKVFNAVVAVLEGSFAYERDGTTFAMRPSTYHLRRLLSAHLKQDDVVVDFGGGLGGTFINNRDLFMHLNQYIVIEQPIFVEAGRELSLKYELPIQFIDDLCNLPAKPDVIIFSSVLQYIPNAELVLQKTANLRPRLIIIDRTALAPNTKTQEWWVQHQHAYYHAPISYPNRPLALDTMLRHLGQYSVLETWKNPFDPDIPPHIGLLLCFCD